LEKVLFLHEVVVVILPHAAKFAVVKHETVNMLITSNDGINKKNCIGVFSSDLLSKGKQSLSSLNDIFDGLGFFTLAAVCLSICCFICKLIWHSRLALVLKFKRR
jgi:hypothetical protein